MMLGLAMSLGSRLLIAGVAVAALWSLIAWQRHDARMDERAAWEARAAIEAARVDAANAAARTAERQLLDRLNDLENRNAVLMEEIDASPDTDADRACGLPRDRGLRLNRIR